MGRWSKERKQKEKYKAAARKKWAEDKEWRDRKHAANSAYYKKKKIELNKRKREKYATDAEYREKRKNFAKKGARRLRARRRKLGLNERGKPLMGKRAADKKRTESLMKWRREFGEENFRKLNSKKLKDFTQKLTPEQKRERMRPAIEAWKKIASVKRVAKRLFGSGLVQSLKE